MSGCWFDWQRTYATIGDRARRTSQRMFLRNLARGEAYSSEAPTMWDVDFQTAVAQAEIEDKEQQGSYYRLRFDDIEIETTRPELVAACVALVAHPEDERYEVRASGRRCTHRSSASRIPSCLTTWPSPTRGRASR